jgi:hypothetical protein
MGWVSRLFGRSDGTVTVRLPADLAEALDNEGDGQGLDASVERVLRAHLSGHCRAVPDDTERMPFWLAGRDRPEGDLEGELRDRMAQRRAAEAEPDDDDDGPSPPRRPPGSRTRRPTRG